MEENKTTTNDNLVPSLEQNIDQTKGFISNNQNNEIIDISSRSINQQIIYLADTVVSLDSKNNVNSVCQKKLTR